MKTKGKETEKKRRKEEKRKWLCPKPNSGPPTHRAKALPLGHVEHTPEFVEILLLRAPVCKNQTNSKFRGKGGKFDFFHILMLHKARVLLKSLHSFFGEISFYFRDKCK